MESSPGIRTNIEMISCDTCGLSFDYQYQYENHVCDPRYIRLNVPVGFGSRDPDHLANLIASDFDLIVPPSKKLPTPMGSRKQLQEDDQVELSKQFQPQADAPSFVINELPAPSDSEEQLSNDSSKILELRKELSQYLNQCEAIVEPYISVHLGPEPFPSIPAIFSKGTNS
jgi:hypothetical protein